MTTEIRTALAGYAQEDIATLTESGSMAITDTKHGVMWLDLNDGTYIISAKGEQILKTDSAEVLTSFLINSYTVA